MGLTLNDKVFKSVSGLSFITYDDTSTYEYFCFATAGSVLTKPHWKIFRLTKANNRVEWCDGNDNFDNVATSLAVVEALSYS